MGNVWDRAVEFLSDHIALILPIAIFALVIPASITGSLQTLAATGSLPVRAGLMLLSLVFAILGLWAQLAIAAMAIDPDRPRGSPGVATARLLPAIGIYLLLITAVFAIFIVQWIAVGAATGINPAAVNWTNPASVQLPAGARGWLLLLLVLDVCMLAALMAKLAPLTGVIVAERRGLGAITRAWALTRGLAWRLVGVIILYAVVTTVSQLAARFVFGAIMRLISGGQGQVTVGDVVTSVIVASVGAAFTVLAAAFCAKLYLATAHAHEARRMAEPEPPREQLA
jgi:hypothetical protein